MGKKLRKHVNGKLLPMNKRCTEKQYIKHLAKAMKIDR